MPKKTPPDFDRSTCPVAVCLDIFGDKWTLLIIRDLLIFGASKYSDFEGRPEAIPTNILADRLKKLVAHGVAEKRAYQARPARYEYLLTDKGRDLAPVVLAMRKWGNRHYPDTAHSPAENVSTRGK